MGIRDEIAVIITRHGDGYALKKTDESYIVSINGDALDEEGVNLVHDDQISFSNLIVRFFVEHNPV